MKSSQLVFARAVALLCGLAMAVLAQSEYDMQNAMGYEFGLATQLCGCRHRGTGCDASKAFSTASHGRVCSAEESVYAVKLNAVVADGCPNAGKVIPGVQVHVWQSNADGTYECADKCNTHLTTGENGQVGFETSHPGPVLRGWQSNNPMQDEDGATRIVMKHRDYTTTMGYVIFNSSTNNGEGVVCTESDEPSPSGLLQMSCYMSMECRSLSSGDDLQMAMKVDGYIESLARQQAPAIRRKPIKGCPKVRHVAKYYKLASVAIVVEICDSSRRTSHPNCNASGLEAFAKNRQDLYAARLVHVLKQPEYCADPADPFCPMKDILHLDVGNQDRIILLDASANAQCCENRRSGDTLLVAGIPLPSPVFSTYSRQAAQDAPPPLPQLSAAIMFPTTRVLSRLFRDAR